MTQSQLLERRNQRSQRENHASGRTARGTRADPAEGFDFEEQLETLLEDVVHQTPNRLQNTSEDTGDVPNSKKGDFVVTLEETGQRIVVEAKNGEFNGTIDSEMEEAIENRDADYGVFVASSLAYLPRTKVGWFSEIDQDYVVVALGANPDAPVRGRDGFRGGF